MFIAIGFAAMWANFKSCFARAYIFALLSALFALPAHAQIVDPRDYSGLRMWVDANDVNGTGVQPANGTTVTTWADKSGLGNSLTATAGVAPTFQTTGFDGINPALRFASGKYMARANPFSSATQNAITVFFVLANDTLTSNSAVSLNGDTASSSYPNGRYLFHTPWGDNNVYFDAGDCCGARRLTGPFPNALTATTLYTGQSDSVTGTQLLRIDGAAFRAGTSALSVTVSGGVRLSAVAGGSFGSFDGRFAEIVLYDRALSLTEIQNVECYLLEKWKPAAMPASCKPSLTVTKTSATWNDGVNRPFNIPGNDVTYTLTVTRGPGVRLSNNSVFAVDSLPATLSFYNGDADGAGPGTQPILFSGVGSGLSFNYATDIAYSNAVAAPTSFAACTYTPTAGYDPNVRHICFNPKGYFTSGSNSASVQFQFRARIP